MKKNLFISLCLLIGACSLNSCSVSTASIDDAKVCSAMADDNLCSENRDQFSASETDTIYATAVLRNAPRGTKVNITWFYLDNNNEKIADLNLDIKDESGSFPIYSRLWAPSSGWPLGKYKVVMDLGTDNTDPVEKKFTIIE